MLFFNRFSVQNIKAKEEQLIKYSVCESTAAITLHIRKVGDEGIVLGGGLNKKSFCGKVMAWDTRIPLPDDKTEQYCCKDCFKKYIEEIRDDSPTSNRLP